MSRDYRSDIWGVTSSVDAGQFFVERHVLDDLADEPASPKAPAHVGAYLKFRRQFEELAEQLWREGRAINGQVVISSVPPGFGTQH